MSLLRNSGHGLGYKIYITEHEKRKYNPQRHNRYDKAFRELAMRMWMNSGRSAEMTAKELGVSVFDLYKWG